MNTWSRFSCRVVKILIWVGCIFVYALIQATLKEIGVILGGIPVMVLFGLTLFGASILCRKWESHCIRKHAKKKGVEPIDIVFETIDPALAGVCENVRGFVPELKNILKNYRLTAVEKEILLEEFSRDGQYTPPQYRSSVYDTKEEETAVRFCRYCGASVEGDTQRCEACDKDL